MASAIASLLPGFLHSTSASGMPFTNSTSSGTMNFLPCVPGMSRRNCETTTKSLLSGCSQSMYRTRWSRPPSQPGSPSTVIPLSRRSGGLLVRFQQARRADPGQGVDRLVQTFLSQPGIAAGAAVENVDLVAEPFGEEHLGERGPTGQGRIGGHERFGRRTLQMASSPCP